MDIAAMKRNVSQHTYQPGAVGLQTQGGAFSQAAKEAQGRLQQRESEILNITMVTDPATGQTYGCTARYSEDSTPENPIISVAMCANGKQEVYEVAVNKVNPQKATGLEMFALCCYMDDTGKGMGGLGSWVKVKTMMWNASVNGGQPEISGKDAFVNQTLNWQEALTHMQEEYLETGLYQQYRQATALLDMLLDQIAKSNQQKEEGISADREEADLWQAIADRKEEIAEKLRRGDTQEKFQIGADSYTLEEWERMMEQFDSLEEIIKQMLSERVKEQRQQAYRQVLGQPEQEETAEI